jgi:uncharacterized protein (TIGR02118 family)
VRSLADKWLCGSPQSLPAGLLASRDGEGDDGHMVKVFALIPRRPDITDEHFHEHWSTTHADHAKRITTLQRYVQSHRIEPGVADLADSIYEGIAEVWFVDLATAAGMGEDPNYVNYAQADEPNFIDLERLTFVMTHEHAVREGAPVRQEDAGAKAMLLLRRRDGLDPTAFAQQLLTSSPAIADAAPDATRVVVCTALADTYTDEAEPAFDGIVELTFDSAQTFELAWSPDVLDAVGAIVDSDRSASFLADELRVIWPEQARATA